MDLKGRTSIEMRIATKDDVTRLNVDGAVRLTGGTGPLPALLGTEAKLALTAALRAGELALERAQLDGRTAHLSATGTRRGGTFDLKWKAALTDLAALAPALRGSLSAEGRARGTPDELALEARARGNMLGAPLELAAQLRHDRDGTLHAAIDRADWKSAHAAGQVTVPAADRVPRGRISLRMTRLDDLQALVDQPLRGSVVADVEFVPQGAKGSARVRVEARDIAAQGFTGNARVDASGPLDALAVRISSGLKDADGYEASLSAAAQVDAVVHTARVEALALQYRGPARGCSSLRRSRLPMASRWIVFASACSRRCWRSRVA